MEKIKKITAKEFETGLFVENTVTETLNGTNDVQMHIKKSLTLDEMISFVQEVVEACVDGESGEYLPEAYDFAIRTAILTHYANFTLPAELDKQYWLVYNTTAVDQIIPHINTRQFNDIISSIDKKINFMLNIISSSAVSKVNEIISKFGDIAVASEKAFAGIDAETMTNIMHGISKLSNMNEKELADIIANVGSEGK